MTAIHQWNIDGDKVFNWWRNLIRNEKQQRLVIKTYIFMKEKSLKEH